MAENVLSGRSLPRPLGRLVTLLPAGTFLTGAGVAVLGLASYVHLAIAGHALSHDEMADLSVMWSLVFTVGYGLFLPIEQELTRVVAARRATGRGSRPAWRTSIALTAAVMGGVVVVLAVASPALARELFGGDAALVWVTAGGLLGVAAAAPLRGQAAGVARFDLYGAELGLDGVLRIACASGLAVAGLHSAVSFGLVLTAAPLLAVLLLVVPVRHTAVPGPPAPWSQLTHGVWPLVISMTLGQFMLNSVIVSARVLAPEQAALTAALLVALILVRVPTLIFGALQATLLSGLAAAAAGTDAPAFLRLVWRGCAIVTALMAATGLVVTPLGPWLVRALFAAPDLLSRRDFAVLTVGTWAYLLALVLGQGVMSLRRHRLQTLCWLAGVAALVAISLLPGDVLTRLGWAYLVGNAVVAVGLAAVLAMTARLHWPHHDAAT